MVHLEPLCSCFKIILHQIFKRILNFLDKIALCSPTHMMSMVDLVAISVETPNIDKVFTKLIYLII